MQETSRPRTFGDYVVDRELGRGGMGIVYAATHRELGKRVAIKVLLAEVSRDSEAIERFKNEARTASAIEHPSIVEIHTVGHDDDSVYIVMELLQGESLGRRLKAKGALPSGDAIAIARQVANALEAAHRIGIVHRDLKPDNVFLVPDIEVPGGERVKLLDFGIAKLLGDGNLGAPSVARTMTGAILGTPHYMSPEQCEGAREVDARSDLYSLGCMLFEMVTGRLPFYSPGVGGLIGMHLHVPPPLLRTIKPSAPGDLEVLIAKLLAKAPDERVQTAGEVAHALQAMTSGRTRGSTLSPPVHVGTRDTIAAQAEVTTADAAKPTRKRLMLATSGAAVGLAALVFAFTRDPDPLEPARELVMREPIEPVTPAPGPQPVEQPAPMPAPKPPDAPELAVARNMIATNDLVGARKVLKLQLDRDPKDPAALAVRAEIDTAQARNELESMRTSVRSKRFELARRQRDQVLALTTDARLRKDAERLWAAQVPEIIKLTREKVAAQVAKTQCASAKQTAKLGEELGESYAKELAACDRAVADEKARHAEIQDLVERIEKGSFPVHIVGHCHALIQKAIDRVPWATCVTNACQAFGPDAASTMMGRAPGNQIFRLQQICPKKPPAQKKDSSE